MEERALSVHRPAGRGRLLPLVDFFHYDFRAQALAKIARGHERDLSDVDAMLARGLVHTSELRDVVRQIAPEMIRYPSLDASAFGAKVERFLDDRELQR